MMNPDALSLEEFEAELVRFTHSRAFAPLPDPLDFVVGLVKENPVQSGSRLLVRLLNALAGRAGTFRSSEVGSLDARTVGAVVQLMRARRTDAPPEESWTRAAQTAQACMDAA